MEVQRIRTEGRRVDAPRNVNRLWIEVTAATSNGATIQGHLARGVERGEDGSLVSQPTRIEIYADRLDAVLARVRTEKHKAVWAQAIELDEIDRLDWIKEHQREYDGKATKERKDAFVNLKRNMRPEHFVSNVLGHKTGLPPLDACKVVHPQSGEALEAAEWKKLPPAQQREWLVDAPATPMNQAERANEALANTLEKVLSRLNRK